MDSLVPTSILIEAQGEACVYHHKLTPMFQDLRSVLILGIENAVLLACSTRFNIGSVPRIPVLPYVFAFARAALGTEAKPSGICSISSWSAGPKTPSDLPPVRTGVGPEYQNESCLSVGAVIDLKN